MRYWQQWHTLLRTPLPFICVCFWRSLLARGVLLVRGVHRSTVAPRKSLPCTHDTVRNLLNLYKMHFYPRCSQDSMPAPHTHYTRVSDPSHSCSRAVQGEQSTRATVLLLNFNLCNINYLGGPVPLTVCKKKHRATQTVDWTKRTLIQQHLSH